MSKIIVSGGTPLAGSITPSANKNAVLPILCASLLSAEPVTLHGVPDITDVRLLLDFFRQLGSAVEADWSTGLVKLHHAEIRADRAVLPVGMRSSVMLIPPMLHRFGRVVLETDAKGCTLGLREIDPHIEVFRAFGATVGGTPGRLVIERGDAWNGARHWLDYASVTTSENFLMCAVTANGPSRLINAACEPHVQELSRFLELMGAELTGVGTSTLGALGQARIGGADYVLAEDYHEVATFLALGAITRGDVRVRNQAPEQFTLLDRTFAKFGVEIVHEDGWSRVARADLCIRPPFTSHMMQKVEAAPWPYVPADLLPIFIALGARSEGQMLFWNKVYEGALGWTSELAKFGGQAVLCDPHRVITIGGHKLGPAIVESPYIIRVAIALLMLACSIEGRSTILNALPIRRAHPGFVENLRMLGAQVEWVMDEEG